MRGRITGISGPTVSVDLKDLKLYERIYVGHSMLTGEVVRIEKERAVVQVYEDTHNLAVGEPVQATGMSLTVQLGPGLLSGTFDGLQRPLKELEQETGPFITSSGNISALNPEKRWEFHALKGPGDDIAPWQAIGFVTEGQFKHYITNTTGTEGRLTWVAEGEIGSLVPVARFEDGSEIVASHEWPARMPRPYRKKLTPEAPLITGQRCIDFLFTLSKGGTAIFPGGFGTGKTILEHSLAKYADADIVIYVGCGERGNEMAELLEEFELLKDPWTQKQLMQRTILCINTSNMPVAAREASIYTAVTMAEYYRDMGLNVLFLADSISRWAEALREISSSLEEMPGEEGYPTYLASRLSSFLERAGIVETMQGQTGSLTMVLSVSPPGGDLTEPVTQACLRNTGAFLMLDTGLAHRRHFPAIDWFQSYSLYKSNILESGKEGIDEKSETARTRCREILQKEESLKEVADIVGVEGLQDTDRLIMHSAEVIRREFLSQNAYTEDAFSTPEETLSKINSIIDFHDSAIKELNEGASLDDILEQSSGVGRQASKTETATREKDTEEL